jgi:hypothetical protein
MRTEAKRIANFCFDKPRNGNKVRTEAKRIANFRFDKPRNGNKVKTEAMRIGISAWKKIWIDKYKSWRRELCYL